MLDIGTIDRHRSGALRILRNRGRHVGDKGRALRRKWRCDDRGLRLGIECGPLDRQARHWLVSVHQLLLSEKIS
jgi:hypothetical protein